MDETMLANLQNSSMTGLDWAIIALYFVVIIALGALVSRGTGDEKGFFLGGRRMPAWAVAMSFAATTLSAATFIGGPEYAYKADLTLLSYEIAKVLAAVLVAVLFLPALYRAGTVTVYGYLGQQVGPAAAKAAGTAFLLGRVLASGARLFIAATAFSLILFDNLETRNLITAIVLFGVVGTLYTALGGIKAVIWTDTLQLVIVVGAVLAAMVLLLRAIPLPVGDIVTLLSSEGKLKVIDTSADLSKGNTLWAALALTLFFAAAFGADQDMAQRLLTCKSLKQAVGSLLGATLIALPITLLFMFTGLLLFVFYLQPEVMGGAVPANPPTDGRKVYAQYLLHELPTGVRGLAMAGLFAAAMSSLDSAMNAMASSATSDLIDPIRKRMGKAPWPGAPRVMVVVMGAVLTLAAVGMVLLYDPETDRLVPFALGVMAFAYAGLMGVFLAVLLTGRGSSASVITALIVGGAVVAAPRVLPGIVQHEFEDPTWNDFFAMLLDVPWLTGPGLAWPYWMVLGTLASFVVCVFGRSGQGTRV